MKPLSLVNIKIGRWTVVSQAESRGGQTRWACRCDCGTERIVSRSTLMEPRNAVKSCGCWRRDRIAKDNYRHGMSESPTWKSWQSMLTRCGNPNSKGYEYWGGRGITICERWREFENFLADMGERPAGTTLDRYPDNDGNYEPGNCRWATPKQQRANQRKQSEAA